MPVEVGAAAVARHQIEYFKPQRPTAGMWQAIAKIIHDEAQRLELRVKELEAKNATLFAQLQAERQAKRPTGAL